MKRPLDGVMTVSQLIEKLKQYDQDLPVLATYHGWVRQGEYFDFNVGLENLENQETGGDPTFYGKQKCVLLS